MQALYRAGAATNTYRSQTRRHHRAYPTRKLVRIGPKLIVYQQLPVSDRTGLVYQPPRPLSISSISTTRRSNRAE
jgi:hypothetical protein